MVVLCAVMGACQPRVKKIDVDVQYFTFCKEMDLGYVKNNPNPNIALSTPDRLDIRRRLLYSSKVSAQHVIEIETRKFSIDEVLLISDRSLEHTDGFAYNILILSDEKGIYYFKAHDDWLGKLARGNCYYSN